MNEELEAVVILIGIIAVVVVSIYVLSLAYAPGIPNPHGVVCISIYRAPNTVIMNGSSTTTITGSYTSSTQSYNWGNCP